MRTYPACSAVIGVLMILTNISIYSAKGEITVGAMLMALPLIPWLVFSVLAFMGSAHKPTRGLAAVYVGFHVLALIITPFVDPEELRHHLPWSMSYGGNFAIAFTVASLIIAFLPWNEVERKERRERDDE